MASDRAASGIGERVFRALGRGILKHPLYPILFWVVLLLVALPFLGAVSSVTTNSATTLPASAPSAVAQAEIDRLFPNQSGGADSLLLLEGPNLTGATGEASVLALTRAIESDPSVTNLEGVSSLYTTYASYLEANGRIAAAAIAAADGSSPSIDASVNATASLLWGPTATYVATWSTLLATHPGTPPASWNAPAYNATAASLGPDPGALEALAYFYEGPPGGAGTGYAGGFNKSADCASAPLAVVACAENTTRATLGPNLDLFLPLPSAQALGGLVLANLGLATFSNATAQRSVALAAVAETVGLAPGFVETVDGVFPGGVATGARLTAWADGVVGNGTLPTYPLPVPPAISFAFLAPNASAELVVVSFDVSDNYKTASGGTPVFDSLEEIARLVPTVLAVTDPGHTLTVLQTGGAPLDQAQNQVLSSSLGLVLPLTVLVLVGITIVYFRAPLAPALTFGGLGIALALGLAGVVLVGRLIEHVDSTSLELQNTFVLGVGTDYSIFLVARYREELWKGADPREAIVTTVTWAGQSIATSGSTAILATLALAFSGVALLEQWGMVLSLAVLIAVLVSLTLVPALLVVVGPRVFWPYTGERFRRHADRTVGRRREERTYFYRVGRAVRRRPRTVVLLLALVSLPLFYVALTAQTSYDFYAQLPAGYSATDGLAALGTHFGPGRAFPTILLVTMASPLLVGNATNLSEFTDLADLATLLNGTSGVASVDSPTGPLAAPLSTWVAYPRLPSATQALLAGTLSGYLGTDGRTVWITVYSSSGGLTAESVRLLDTLRGTVDGFASAHPDVVGVAFGGGAAVTSDIEQQTALATQRLLLAVSLGLMAVLLLVLRSWLIPPLAVATIGVSIGWAWGATNLVLGSLAGYPIFYFVPTVMFVLILGLGIDYNIFLLTRVREERLRGHSSDEAMVQALASTGGIISAAAVILASAFAILMTSEFLLLKAIGFAVATAVVLDAMVVRTYLVPASMFLLGERVWRLRRPPVPPSNDAARPTR